MRMIIAANSLLCMIALASASEPCTADCLVTLEQPHAEYARSASIRLSVRNTSPDSLNVSAVLDALVDGVWRATPLTVSDQDHGFKIVRLSPIKPGAALVLNYPACVSLKSVPRGGCGRGVLIPCPKNVSSPVQPFRRHVFVHGQCGGTVNAASVRRWCDRNISFSQTDWEQSVRRAAQQPYLDSSGQ